MGFTECLQLTFNHSHLLDWIFAFSSSSRRIPPSWDAAWPLQFHHGTSKLPRLLVWYSVKMHVIFGVRFERRKLEKKANLHEKMTQVNSFPEPCECFCQISSTSLFSFGAIPFPSWVVFGDTVQNRTWTYTCWGEQVLLWTEEWHTSVTWVSDSMDRASFYIPATTVYCMLCGRLVLQVKRPNQQYRSNEGRHTCSTSITKQEIPANADKPSRHKNCPSSTWKQAADKLMTCLK